MEQLETWQQCSCHFKTWKMVDHLFIYLTVCVPCFYRYSDSTIETVEMLDNDDKIDLELILALIRHIVLNDQVSLALCSWFHGSQSESGTTQVS